MVRRQDKGKKIDKKKIKIMKGNKIKIKMKKKRKERGREGTKFIGVKHVHRKKKGVKIDNRQKCLC